MIKFRLYFDKDKETQWLNEMANEGWAARSFFAGVYNFEQCEKGEYQYQIDFCDKVLTFSDDYREFMRDNDVEIVQRWGFWVILRKKTSDGEFVLYSDVDSQLEHYNKILRMFQAVTFFEFLILLFEVYGASTTHSAIAWAAVFLIMAIEIVLINAVVNTRNIVSELNERKTGIVSDKKSNVSALLMVGMLFNSCALLIGDNSPYTVKLLIQVLAIIFMLCGVYDTAKKVKAARQ